MTCRVCGSEELKILVRWELYDGGDYAKSHQVRCKGCSSTGEKFTRSDTETPLSDAMKSWEVLYGQSLLTIGTSRP